jgi:hypothetical protein
MPCDPSAQGTRATMSPAGSILVHLSVAGAATAVGRSFAHEPRINREMGFRRQFCPDSGCLPPARTRIRTGRSSGLPGEPETLRLLSLYIYHPLIRPADVFVQP